jgi:hypothetical protein
MCESRLEPLGAAGALTDRASSSAREVPPVVLSAMDAAAELMRHQTVR